MRTLKGREVESLKGKKFKLRAFIVSIDETPRGFIPYFGSHGDADEPVYKYSHAFKTRVEAKEFLSLVVAQFERAA